MNILHKDQDITFRREKHIPFHRHGINNVLVVGFGSTCSTVLFLLQNSAQNIACITRNSPCGRRAFEQVCRSEGRIELSGKINGTALIDEMYLGFGRLREAAKIPDIIFLCVPNQQYAEVIKKLHQEKLLAKGQTIVAISSRLGCSMDITHTIDELFARDSQDKDTQDDDACALSRRAGSKDFAIVVFSMYYAVTKKLAADCHTRYQVAEFKNQIYIGIANRRPHHKQAIELITGMLVSVDVKTTLVDKLLEAEIYNINIHIHAQLLIADRVLKDLFCEQEDKTFYKYMYNLEQDRGVVNDQACERIIASESEINAIYQHLQLQPLDYLDLECHYYRYDDDINREVARYPTLELPQKIALLTTVLTFAHFKDIKLERIHMTRDGNGNMFCRVPRLPKEDYVAIVILTEIGKLLATNTPALQAMRDCFENFVNDFERATPCKTDLDLPAIASEARKMAHMIIEQARAPAERD